MTSPRAGPSGSISWGPQAGVVSTGSSIQLVGGGYEGPLTFDNSPDWEGSCTCLAAMWVQSCIPVAGAPSGDLPPRQVQTTWTKERVLFNPFMGICVLWNQDRFSETETWRAFKSFHRSKDQADFPQKLCIIEARPKNCIKAGP